MSEQKQDIERLYDALQRLESGLGGKRLLSACTGTQEWPESGVYFFFESGELRKDSSVPRVVRVGVNRVSRGSKATLWNRLRTHRGSVRGTGNHRGSVFRLHVGSAIAMRSPEISIDSWGKGSSAPTKIRKSEEGLEQEVSCHIGAMSVLWVAVEDEAGPESDRAYLEQNLIGLLSSNGDSPSSQWLGRFSPKKKIQKAGLWNLNHIDYPYCPDFIDMLDKYVAVTIENFSKP